MNSKHFQTSKIILFLKCKYFFQKINKQLIYIVCQLQHRKGISSFKFYFLCEFKEGFYAQERERENTISCCIFVYVMNKLYHTCKPSCQFKMDVFRGGELYWPFSCYIILPKKRALYMTV